ncbi:hypothetical protein M427DRAFT_135704 [Gonapodya prolifera JEL478]|uniref:CENP-V/GFA domain-containing protein n=1 Tax=Gonapodya prolifera (strain JEL478) TaxID=1344416 RepID=A0A139ACP0_GONPJ|nr:hypothetical protein M427DRAFT_135704 [Gonapodya prolifera JEL478]|eukprot:KXS14581.1 hypothetical protein M427DRAFT_135704 [Gonapodya prolifera JEL478]
MNDATHLTFSCLCQRVQFAISTPRSSLPITAHVCHCSICRRTHGTLFTVDAHVPSPPVWITPSSPGECTRYTATPYLKRLFCSTCGTHVLDYAVEAGDEGWYVSSATLAAVNGVKGAGAGGVFDLKTQHCTKSVSGGGAVPWWKTVGGVSLQEWNPDEDDSTPSSDAPAPHALVDGETRSGSGSVRAHCHCGGVSFFVRSPVPGVDYSPSSVLTTHARVPADTTKWLAVNCFCDQCRLAAGVLAAQWAFVPISAITVLQQGSHMALPDDLRVGTSKIYRSSPPVTRTFCGTCGATVFYHHAGWPGMVDLAVGLLDAPRELGGARADRMLEWIVEDDVDELVVEGRKYHAEWVQSVQNGLREWGAVVAKASLGQSA